MGDGASLILAAGLGALWIIGLGHHATGWLTWLDGLAALGGFAIVLGVSDLATGAIKAGGPIALGMALGVFWIIGLATGSTTWLIWSTFAFACAYILVGIGAAYSRREAGRTTPRPA
jgi:hypothetical protein